MKDLLIQFEQPIWLLLPVLLVSIAISAFLYYRNTKQGFSIVLNSILFILRFFVLIILGVLLLNPYFIQKTKTLEKPKIVVAIDASESMLNSSDSLKVTHSINHQLEQIKKDLSAQFDIDILSFNSRTYSGYQHSFTGKRTDIGQMLKYVSDKYYMLNLSALILLSDGQNNQGLSPEYSIENQSFEIYPVIFGDTSSSPDFEIKKIFYNNIIRQNGQFPIDVMVQSIGFKNKQFTIQVEHQGKVIASKVLKVAKDKFTKEVNFDLFSDEKGLQSYTVRVLSNEKEKNNINNVSKFYVQFVKTGNKILLLANAPHPDLGAIASALRTSDSYSVDVKTLNDFPFKIDDYQLIIMHGLPSVDERSKSIFADKLLKNKSIWYIMSTTTSNSELAKQEIAWHLSTSKGNFEHVEAIYEDDFTDFQWSRKYRNKMNEFPPIYAPFASFQKVKKAEVMMWQSMRGFQSEKPLLSFWSKGFRKYALLSGEGIWKWRIYNYQSFGNHDLFNDLINTISKYLLTGVYDDYFNISYQNIYNETDVIEWEAQVYNQAFELIPEAEINVDIQDSYGHVYPYQFTAQSATYSLNLDYLEPGEYSFTAKATTKDTSYIEKGNFVVNAWNMEQSKMGAKRELLEHLATISSGKTYMPSQLEKLDEYLRNRPDFKPRSSFTQKLINLIDIKWLAILIIILLSMEWGLRKRYGSF